MDSTQAVHRHFLITCTWGSHRILILIVPTSSHVAYLSSFTSSLPHHDEVSHFTHSVVLLSLILWLTDLHNLARLSQHLESTIRNSPTILCDGCRSSEQMILTPVDVVVQDAGAAHARTHATHGMRSAGAAYAGVVRAAIATGSHEQFMMNTTGQSPSLHIQPRAHYTQHMPLSLISHLHLLPTSS